MNFDEWFKKRHLKTGIYEKTLFSDDDATYLKHEMGKSWDYQQKKLDCCREENKALLKLVNELKGNKKHIHKFEEITVNGDDARKYICIYCGFEKSESFND